MPSAKRVAWTFALTWAAIWIGRRIPWINDNLFTPKS